jgi:succinoglycan biosynthesis protein ExoM
LIDARLAGTPRAVVKVRARNLGRGTARIMLGGIRYLAGVVLRSDRHQARGMRIVWRGTGMVTGALGLIYQEYARENGRRWQFARQPRGKVAKTIADHSSLSGSGQP